MTAGLLPPPCLIIKSVFLNAFFQNGSNQFIRFHSVDLTNHNQLCKGILLYENRILFLIRTQLTHADAECVRNPATFP